MEYVVRRCDSSIELTGDWSGSAWQKAETAEILNWRPEGSDHQPRTRVRLLYDGTGVHGIYDVEDKYVRCVATKFQDIVCRDSCVEFFVRPKPDKGYFNFEFSGDGMFLVYYVTDSTRLPGGPPMERGALSAEDGKRVGIFHSLPDIVEPEIQEATEWVLQFFIPFDLLEKYVGPIGDVSGQTWRANFYKCGDETSHQHWGSWSPVDELNFHLPHCFGDVRFE